MAVIGPEVTTFLGSGSITFLLLLLLVSIFLTALCSACNSNSFELRDPDDQKHPSVLIRVVMLEEGRENPMISQIQNEEKEFPTKRPEESISPPRDQQVEQESASDLNRNSHQDFAHIYSTIGEGRGFSSESPSHPANNSPGHLRNRDDPEPVSDPGKNSPEYAQISKKVRLSSSPEEMEEAGEGEETSPSLPMRGRSEEGDSS